MSTPFLAVYSSMLLILLISLLLVPFANAATAHAAAVSKESRCIQRTCFPLERSVMGERVALRGAGLLEFWRMDIYTTGFYINAPKAVREPALGLSPMILELHYHRHLKALWIVEAAVKCLKQNPNVQYEAIKDRVDQIGLAYQDVDKGDIYELSYFPGQGTTLSLNGKSLITIPGEDFARDYFGIWLGNPPINQNLKDKLLGS